MIYGVFNHKDRNGDLDPASSEGRDYAAARRIRRKNGTEFLAAIKGLPTGNREKRS